jgi:hypothetical protein
MKVSTVKVVVASDDAADAKEEIPIPKEGIAINKALQTLPPLKRVPSSHRDDGGDAPNVDEYVKC